MIYNNESLKRLNNSVTYDRGVWKMKNEKWEKRNEKWEQSYKLTEKDFFNKLSRKKKKMNYYWFNRQEILQKAKDKYSKKSCWVL